MRFLHSYSAMTCAKILCRIKKKRSQPYFDDIIVPQEDEQVLSWSEMLNDSYLRKAFKN